jgi:hypothetical protein
VTVVAPKKEVLVKSSFNFHTVSTTEEVQLLSRKERYRSGNGNTNTTDADADVSEARGP